ncbi:hypothetical protein ACLOJK_032657 [Asimina triloba]
MVRLEGGPDILRHSSDFRVTRGRGASIGQGIIISDEWNKSAKRGVQIVYKGQGSVMPLEEKERLARKEEADFRLHWLSSTMRPATQASPSLLHRKDRKIS